MKKWLRRIRGAIGIGLAWGMAWFAAGMVLLLIVGTDAADVPFPLGFGALGFLAGATFSLILGWVAGGRRFEQISLPRFTGWGAVGGVVFYGLFALGAAALGETIPLRSISFLAPLFALAGAGSAAGSLALARRAEEPELLDDGAAADEARLGRGEGSGTLERGD